MTFDVADIAALIGLCSIGAGLYLLGGLAPILIELGSVLVGVAVWWALHHQAAKK